MAAASKLNSMCVNEQKIFFIRWLRQFVLHCTFVKIVGLRTFEIRNWYRHSMLEHSISDRFVRNAVLWVIDFIYCNECGCFVWELTWIFWFEQKKAHIKIWYVFSNEISRFGLGKLKFYFVSRCYSYLNTWQPKIGNMNPQLWRGGGKQ